MGDVKGTEQFYHSQSMQLIKLMLDSLKKKESIDKFGVDCFKDDERVEKFLLDWYFKGIYVPNDIHHLRLASQAFEMMLHKEFRASACFEGSMGNIYLKENNGKMFFEVVHKDDIFFHSNSARGFKAIAVPKRFENAIMHRLSMIEANNIVECRKLKKQLEKDAMLMKVREFADVFNECQNLELAAFKCKIDIKKGRAFIKQAKKMGIKMLGIKKSIKVGILGGAMKPVHKGHWGLIEKASAENDEVMLLISLSDRESDGVTIKNETMQAIWQKHLIPMLPPNVKIKFVDNPTRAIYEILGKANEAFANDRFTVYSDPKDISERFPSDKQMKYFGNLVERKHVTFKPIERKGKFNVSASQARKLLQSNDRDGFIKLMPAIVNGGDIYDILVGDT
jgi:cytidyltransferase-like protein